ncbi:MAG TPA: DUF2000 family protein [Thermomicrobiales bacterium]|nr:DUF2000 family protein [Thermomicrobiales bacterium]
MTVVPDRITFDTKIAVVVRDDLATWQACNVTAFTVAGIAATTPETIGEEYEDGSGQRYLPMFRQPVLVYSASAAELRRTHERAVRRNVRAAIYTEDLFTTYYDAANRAAVAAVPTDALNLVGLALHAERRVVDKIVAGLSFLT